MMTSLYLVLGAITFWCIVAFVVYEFILPYVAAAVLAVRFIQWYDREAKRVNPDHKYKVGPLLIYADAYRQMLDRIRTRRAGMTVEITHHSGAKFK